MEKKFVYLGLGIFAVFLLLAIVYVRRPSQPVAPVMPAVPTATPAPKVSEASISGEWVWNKTTMSDGKVTTPVKSDAFVLTLADDGMLSSTTDCNSLRGSYEILPDNGIKISELASTLMFCEGSQEASYSAQLQQVNSFKRSGAELWLMLPFDSGTMIFTGKG